MANRLSVVSRYVPATLHSPSALPLEDRRVLPGLVRNSRIRRQHQQMFTAWHSRISETWFRSAAAARPSQLEEKNLLQVVKLRQST